MLENGTVAIPPFELSLSELLDDKSKVLHIEQMNFWQQMGQDCNYQLQDDPCGRKLRETYRNHLLPLINKQRSRYAVNIKRQLIAGIEVELFEPVNKGSSFNKDAILINLHGGGFVTGDIEGGQIESIPIAAVSGITVISINYSLAPDVKFPVASEEVIAVYNALLQDYPASAIGIYGASAGALLTSQVVAGLIKRNIALPAALGLFALGAADYAGSDSADIVSRLENCMLPDAHTHPYYGNEGSTPSVFPALSERLMSLFPPTLLISSVRDLGLSSVVYTHSQMIKQGVSAELMVWEGLRHCFFYDPDFEQSREMYQSVARYFNHCLAGGA